MVQRNRFLGVFLLAVLGLGITGCQKSMVTRAEVRTWIQNQDAWAEVTVDLTADKLLFPSVELPIQNPASPDHPLGSFGLRDILGGGTELAIAVNLSEATQSPGADGRYLPSGAPIPMAVPAGVVPVSFSVQGTTRVYLALGNGVAMIGGAMVIKEFDAISHTVPGFNLFIPFSFPVDQKTNITGSAGLFTGNQPLTSGVAVFVDLSQLLKNSPEIRSLALKGMALNRAAEFQAQAVAGAQAMAAPSAPSPMDEAKVKIELSKIAARGQRLHLAE